MQKKTKQAVEAYVVSCARLGDRAALEHLAAVYHKKYLSHAYRLLGDAEQARDAVQDGWLAILRGLPKLKDDGVFSAWSFRIITRKCAKHISKLQKDRKVRDSISAQPTTGNRSDQKSEMAVDHKPVREALANLPAEHRAAVALFYLQDMRVAEVAVALDIPVGTVKSRLVNARKHLRAALEGKRDG